MNVIIVKESTVALWLIQLNYNLMIESTKVIIVSTGLNVEGIYMKTNNYLLISHKTIQVKGPKIKKQ